MTNVDPPDEIPEGQHTKYRGLYGKCVSRKFDKFPEISKRERLREDIDTHRNHRKLVSYAVFPFAEESPAGYKIVRVEPLEELGAKNMDFLLYDMDGHAIIGDAKSSIPQNALRVVNQIVERKQVAFEHKDYIEDEYVGEEISELEIVVVTYVRDAEKIGKEIGEQGEDIITWAVDPHSDSMWVKQTRLSKFPDNLESEEPNELLEELDRRLTHSVAELNSKLDRIDTSFGQADILPSSIIVDQLRVVLQARKVLDRKPCVDHGDIVSIVQDSILNYSEERINQIVDNLIASGKEINFLADWDGPEADYKIVSNYTARDDLETVLEDKWVDWRIERMKDDLRAECEERITADIGRQKQLSEFGVSVG